MKKIEVNVGGHTLSFLKVGSQCHLDRTPKKPDGIQSCTRYLFDNEVLFDISFRDSRFLFRLEDQPLSLEITKVSKKVIRYGSKRYLGIETPKGTRGLVNFLNLQLIPVPGLIRAGALDSSKLNFVLGIDSKKRIKSLRYLKALNTEVSSKLPASLKTQVQGELTALPPFTPSFEIDTRYSILSIGLQEEIASLEEILLPKTKKRFKV